jgi:membrane associated rhomboid family serine protease
MERDKGVAMIIPIAHEDQRGRRWPYVTIAIIAINVVIFLFTNSRMQQEQQEIFRDEFHILALHALYPNVPIPSEAADMVESFKREHASLYGVAAERARRPLDSWDAQLLSGAWSNEQLNQQMTTLTSRLDQIHHDSITWNYAFHPYHPTAISYLTANFLHGGWLHIIFNMWFLWLAGCVLEDTWGRVVYPVFYLLCGVLSMTVHGGVFRGSFTPVVGASGAIAGLMGGFLARFPKTKIKLAWLFLFRIYKFSVPAYIILPLWLVIQIFWGAVSGNSGGVAYWVHVGGFAFGMVMAVVLRQSGIEQTVDQAIESKVTWTADAPLVRATELLGDNQAGAAVVELQKHVQEKPDSLDALEVLLKAQERTSDTAGQKDTLEKLCRLYLTEGETQRAWDAYEHFTLLGGEKLPRGVWLELCRYLESNQNWERAVSEYKRFAEKNASERASVPALVSAARICLTKLYRTADAQRLFRAAQASPVPHLDLERVIEEGLKSCAAAAPTQGSYRGS